MEKFEIAAESGLEVFTSLVTKTKESLTDLSKNIKTNIKKYQKNIDNAEKDIADAASSRGKCEEEIDKLKAQIDTIKGAIENVESTYKNIEAAYASTSVGDTKNIYSEIISEARINCEKDVEKNRSEIARLNSDIEAIKNNIQEFDHSIDELTNSLDAYKLELAKYEKANDYFEKMLDKAKADLQDIADYKLPKSKMTPRKVTSKNTKEEPKNETKEKDSKTEFSNPVLDALEVTSSFTIIDSAQKENSKEKEKDKKQQDEQAETQPLNETINSEKFVPEESQKVEETDELFEKDEIVKEPAIDQNNISGTNEMNPSDNIFDFANGFSLDNNLENLFATPSEDIKDETSNKDYDDADMTEWEQILNGTDNLFDIPSPEAPQIVDLTVPVEPQVIKEENNELKELNQLLEPYNTNYDRLRSIAGANIIHKDGTITPFDINIKDVTNAINNIDAQDLRAMKIVGPEITILRRVKTMKEGK